MAGEDCRVVHKSRRSPRPVDRLPGPGRWARSRLPRQDSCARQGGVLDELRGASALYAVGRLPRGKSQLLAQASDLSRDRRSRRDFGAPRHASGPQPRAALIGLLVGSALMACSERPSPTPAAHAGVVAPFSPYWLASGETYQTLRFEDGVLKVDSYGDAQRLCEGLVVAIVRRGDTVAVGPATLKRSGESCSDRDKRSFAEMVSMVRSGSTFTLRKGEAELSMTSADGRNSKFHFDSGAYAE